MLRNPKVTIITDDGRRWLSHHPERRFDAIVSNTTWNFRANVTNLLSAEFLNLVQQHLNPLGILFYNTTGLRPRAANRLSRRFRTGHGSPTTWWFPKRRSTGISSVGAKPWNLMSSTAHKQFDVQGASDRALLDSLMVADQSQPVIEGCPEVLSRTAGMALVTDDNMGTEWRHFLRLE